MFGGLAVLAAFAVWLVGVLIGARVREAFLTGEISPARRDQLYVRVLLFTFGVPILMVVGAGVLIGAGVVS